MYSLVLMAAMTATPATPACHWGKGCGCYGGYGYGYAGYGGVFGGYYDPWYDPWYGAYPGYSGGYQASSDEGALRLKIKPKNAEVYVDGYYVGIVDEFDGIFQRLHIDAGSHRVEGGHRQLPCRRGRRPEGAQRRGETLA